MPGKHPYQPKPAYRLAPDGTQYYAYDDNGQPLCGKVYPDGHICRSHPVTGRKRCRFHGGHAKQGPEHPNYKHGKRVQRAYNLPTLATLTRQFMEDPEYLSLAREIAMLRGLLEQSAVRMDSLPELGISVKLAREGYGKIQDAMTNPDPAAAAIQLQSGVSMLGRALNDLNSEQELRDDLRRTAATLRNLVTQETIFKKLNGAYLPLPVFITLLSSVQEGVRALRLDEKQTRQFETVIRDILSQQPMLVVGKAEYIDETSNDEAPTHGL